MAELLDFSPVRALDLNGVVAPGAKVKFYQSGTTTGIPVYTTSALDTVLAGADVAVTADASGIFPAVWASTGAVKAVVTESDGTPIITIDPVFRTSSTATAAGDIAFEPTDDVAENNVQDAIVSVFTTLDAAIDAEATARLQGRGMTNATAVSTASGTAFDFTGIPSWATEIEIKFFGQSLSGTDHLLVQVGTSGGIVSSGYACVSGTTESTSVATTTSSAGFVIYVGLGTDAAYGRMLLSKLNNNWISTHNVYRSTTKESHGAGAITQTNVDRVRITRTGSNTFDGGELQVAWR